MEALTNSAELFLKEFEDVVLLRTVHRVDYGDARDGSGVDWSQYAADADKFLDVTLKMASCTWTLQEHAWLAKRNRSTLFATHVGREELVAFEEAPLLMDTRRKKANGDDGADQINEKELEKVALKTRKAIIAIRSYHAKLAKEHHLKPELTEGDDFRGLLAELRLCEGARVLLIHNVWVEAGLMNGALGIVRGFVWPEGGDPWNADASKRAPLCLVIEFDNVNLGEEQSRDESGRLLFHSDGQLVMQSRCFFSKSRHRC